MRIPAPAGFPGLEDLLGTTSDDSKDRCASLLRALTDLYLQRPVHALEDDHYYTELALRLIDSADVSERATLAARLAACPSAPLPVLKRLARDTIEVAGPILQHLPHLRTAEFESPTAADTRAPWQIIASGLQRTQPAARRSHHAHPVGPSELSELFYRATAPERRLCPSSRGLDPERDTSLGKESNSLLRQFRQRPDRGNDARRDPQLLGSRRRGRNAVPARGVPRFSSPEPVVHRGTG